MFYELNRNDVLKEYSDGIKNNFFFARANGSRIITDHKPKSNPEGPGLSQNVSGQKSNEVISLACFLGYAANKKIKLQKMQIYEVLWEQQDREVIDLTGFTKLLILASCGGDKKMLAPKNFIKLMDHMDIAKNQ